MTIKVTIDAEGLQNLTRQLRICSETLKKDIRTTNDLLSTIDNSWNGEELHSLIAKAHNSTMECLQLSDTLLALAKHLDCVRSSYQQAEEYLIQNFRESIT